MTLKFQPMRSVYENILIWRADQDDVRYIYSHSPQLGWIASVQKNGGPIESLGEFPDEHSARMKLDWVAEDPRDRIAQERQTGLRMPLVAMQEAGSQPLPEADPPPKGKPKRPALTYQFYKSKGQWRWRARARNGKIVAQGEGYHNKQDCLDAIALLIGSSPDAEVVEAVPARKAAKKSSK